MRQVFVDTVHWIALMSPGDGLHDAAKAAHGGLGPATRLLTTDFVLTKFLNAFASRGAYLRARARDSVSRILRDPNCDVVPASRSHFEKAVALYADRSDQDHSLTDCVSIVVMKERQVSEVLSTDQCFAVEGFQRLLSLG